MYGVLFLGNVDRVILIGGIFYLEMVVKGVVEKVLYLVLIEIVLGEMEMEVFVLGVFRVFNGEEIVKIY